MSEIILAIKHIKKENKIYFLIKQEDYFQHTYLLTDEVNNFISNYKFLDGKSLLTVNNDVYENVLLIYNLVKNNNKENYKKLY